MRISDNKRRMKELGLLETVKEIQDTVAIRPAAASRSVRMPREIMEPSRRSERDRPSVNYLEDPFAGTRLARSGGGGRGPGRQLTEEEQAELINKVLLL